MKYAFLLVVLVICAVAYLYYEQPKIWNDCLAAMKAPEVVSPAPPIATAATNAPPDATAPTNSEASTPPNAPNVDTPTGSIPNTNTGVTIPKVFTPPEPIPAQANWTWTVQGKDYHNVVVTKVEADTVSIMYDGGMGRINTSDLTPDLQKMFNYDPQASALASHQKAAALAQAEAAEAPRIAAEQQREKAQADADEKARLAGIQAENNHLASGAAQDQIRNLQNDMHDMEQAHEVTVSVSYVGNPPTQVVNYGGSTYWLDKYYADQAAIARLQSQAASH
jgi:hypothetical protein